MSNTQTRSGDIAAVVVSEQSAATLDECLQRLRRATGIEQIRVIDNDSNDGSQEITQRQALADRRLRFIINPHNPGLATSRNQGVHASNAPWLVFIKPEIMVETNILARLRDLGQQLGDCLLSVEHVDEYGVLDHSIRRCDLNLVAMLHHPFSAIELNVAPDPHKVLQPVPALSAALLLMPRSLFERLNGWDSGYRWHVEDLDLCRRAREIGAVVAIVNTLKVVHLREISSQSSLFWAQWYKHRDLWRYFCKFQAPHYSLLIRIAVAAVINARAVVALTRALLGFLVS